MSADLDTMTAADLRRRVISRDVSPVELIVHSPRQRPRRGI